MTTTDTTSNRQPWVTREPSPACDPEPSKAEPAYAHDGKFDELEETLQKEVSFFRSLMSIDEAKTSVLMLCLMVSLLFGGVAYLLFGNLSDNWTSLIETFTYCVTGINVVAAFNSKGMLGQFINRSQDPHGKPPCPPVK